MAVILAVVHPDFASMPRPDSCLNRRAPAWLRGRRERRAVAVRDQVTALWWRAQAA